MDLGEYGPAITEHSEGLRLARAVGDQPFIANLLHNLAKASRQQGDVVRAFELLNESNELCNALGFPYVIVENLEALARVAQAAGRPDETIRLVAAAAVARDAQRASAAGRSAGHPRTG
jgi:hypothetical protein